MRDDLLKQGFITSKELRKELMVHKDSERIQVSSSRSLVLIKDAITVALAPKEIEAIARYYLVTKKIKLKEKQNNGKDN